MSALTTTWTQLLIETNRRDYLSEDEQKICERHTFYKLMDAMARIDWLKCRTENGNGCIRKKYYEITFEGAIVALAFEGKI